MTPVPQADVVGGLWLACALFALFSAFGILTSISIRLTCILYSSIYFSSQIDSYQHHYLLCLLLLLFSIPSQRFWAMDGSEDERRSCMPLLLYLQIALVYFWTGVAKLDSTWLTGVTMKNMSNSEIVLGQVGELAAWLYGMDTEPGLALDAMYKTLSFAVMLGELLIPLCFIIKKLRIVGFIITPFFHVGVELGLDIELFSFYMISINFILLKPDWLWRRLDSYGTTCLDQRPSQRFLAFIIVSAMVSIALLRQIEFPNDLFCQS